MAISSPREFELENMRSQVATLEQLLAVHERTSLQQSQRLESILKSISDGFFALDRAWLVTYLNPVAEFTFAAMGPPGTELVGRTLWSRFPLLEHGEFHTNCLRAMDEGVQANFEVYFEALDAHLEFHIYPWDDGVSVYFQDVSPRKLAERGREQMHAELERLVEMRTADLQATLGELEAFSYSV